jgi:glycosyltransferase involved in cell wall biosynthesis
VAAGHELVRSVSVFFPAYNDANSLPSLIEAVFAVLRRRIDDYEVIIVNDGSTDGAAELLDGLVPHYRPLLRVITHPHNLGYGAALRTGFAAATKDWIFYTDGDGQYDPTELELLLDAVGSETDLVNGYKIQRRDPWHRVVIGDIYNRCARSMFRIPIRDIDCDFRLIRRELMDRLDLQSTSGAICPELVRKLDLTTAEIAEVPVSHYRRVHGRSQFFRWQSLATTFFQLSRLLFQLVLRPSLGIGQVPEDTCGASATKAPAWIWMAVAIVFVSTLAYGRALLLPYIADDYVQIQLGRDYGPTSNWAGLMSDPLYRCRATSILMTYWTERLFGLSSVAFNISSLVVHVLNSFLVFMLGAWRPIGPKVAGIAALVFATSSLHQEAVIWYAALPELLVFTFTLSSFLCWIRWVQSFYWYAYASSFALFIAALLSKESAVALVPLMAMGLFLHDRKVCRNSISLAPFVCASVFYFVLAYYNRSVHLHFNDGTFSLQAPFMRVVINSIGRLMWFWGVIGIAALGWWRAWKWRTLIAVAAMWMVITLLPYSFLTYMLRVPSRHTYFAGVGASLIVAAALVELWNRTSPSRRLLPVCLLATVILLHNVGYIWTKKHEQFVARAAPTEQLLEHADRTSGPLNIKCFPYDDSVAILALRMMARPEHRFRSLNIGRTAASEANALDLCNGITGRGRF